MEDHEEGIERRRKKHPLNSLNCMKTSYFKS